MPRKVLVVDDEPVIRDLFESALSREPYVILSAASAEDALEILDHEAVDVVISDEKMPGLSGSEFLVLVREKYPDTIRIVLTGHPCIEAAIRSINQGEIYRFFTKPCNVIDLAFTIRQALRQKELMEENQRLLKTLKDQSSFIESLEKRYPGITKIKKGSAGEIIIEGEKDDHGEDFMLEEMSSVLKKCAPNFPCT
ncbi:MAG: response regulator [Pseudomonadota bacterium]